MREEGVSPVAAVVLYMFAILSCFTSGACLMYSALSLMVYHDQYHKK